MQQHGMLAIVSSRQLRRTALHERGRPIAQDVLYPSLCSSQLRQRTPAQQEDA